MAQIFHIALEHTPLMTEQITYRNRKTDEMISEPLILPRIQYAVARSHVAIFIYNIFLNTYPFCWLLGKWMDLSGSQKKIQPFVQKYDINLNEIELPLNQYKNLNAFFSRKLKPDARPFIADSHIFCSPADGKVLAYPKLNAQTRLPVKGSHVDIAHLLSSKESATPYRNGAALVIRLAPADYHRYHFPVAGIATSSTKISGRYYLVNPIALDVKPDLFAHNKREVTYLETEHFGRIMIMEVAGWGVGRIVQTYQPGNVERGQEKGYFQFGGSTLVLLFEPGRIVFDNDLTRDTQADIEVQVHAGSQLGVQAVS